MVLVDKLRELIAKNIAETSLAIVLSALAGVALFADLLLPQTAFEALGRIATGRIMLGLFLALLGLLAWVVYLHPRLRFDKRSGSYLHVKTGLRYCTKCKIELRLKSPMKEANDGSGWRCQVCANWYVNPEYKEPPPAPVKRDPHGWMRL